MCNFGQRNVIVNWQLAAAAPQHVGQHAAQPFSSLPSSSRTICHQLHVTVELLKENQCHLACCHSRYYVVILLFVIIHGGGGLRAVRLMLHSSHWVK